MKPLIVGEAPGQRGDGEPLAGRSGRRLADLCGLTLEEFLGRFDRVNVLDRWPGKAGDGKGDAWPNPEATVRGAEIARTAFAGRAVVVLGGRVARAVFPHGVERRAVLAAPLRFFGTVEAHGRSVAMCPHPSGVNRWWNDPENVSRAQEFWRAFAARARP